MKSYKEVAENVLKRRDKYLAEKKRKHTIVYRSVAVGFSFCMVVLVGVGIWNNQKIKDTTDFIHSSEKPEIIIVTEPETPQIPKTLLMKLQLLPSFPIMQLITNIILLKKSI